MQYPKINIPETQHERIVVVGGGFSGMELIKKLQNRPYQVVLLDKNNYFTFQPLLYQVATSGLEATSVVYPFRRMFRQAENVFFRMAEVEEVAPDAKRIFTLIGYLDYDRLVLASGGQSNYFNLPPADLMALKSLESAVDMKNALLQSFERALESSTKTNRRAHLNIVIAGGGPTGVELAGALGEMKKFVLPKDYPQLDFSALHILLLEGKDRLLPTMSAIASEKAKKYLEQLGVTVRLGEMVLGYEDDQVQLKNEAIRSKNLIWTAGIKATDFGGLDNAERTKGGRLVVDTYHRLPDFSDIFAIGDLAAMPSEEYPYGHPMLAPVAIQQGKHLAKNLLGRLKDKKQKGFEYKDKGTMATIGRNRAVVDAPWFKMQGTLAWFAWMFVHLISLVGFRNKIITLIDWSYNYFTYDRALRLITTTERTKKEIFEKTIAE